MFQKQNLKATSSKGYNYGTEEHEYRQHSGKIKEKPLGNRIDLKKQNKNVEGTNCIWAPPARHNSL
jgi:hypothetical protein